MEIKHEVDGKEVFIPTPGKKAYVVLEVNEKTPCQICDEEGSVVIKEQRLTCPGCSGMKKRWRILRKIVTEVEIESVNLSTKMKSGWELCYTTDGRYFYNWSDSGIPIHLYGTHEEAEAAAVMAAY